MMHSDNPYTTPDTANLVSPLAQVDPTSYYLDGNQLFVRDGTELPNICVLTGDEIPNAKRRNKTLYWASPWWALLILTGLLVYIIVYLCVRKKFTLQYSISTKALIKRRLKLTGALLLSLGGFPAALYLGSLNNQNEIFGITAFILAGLAFIGLIVTAIFSNLFRPKKHREGWFSINGVNKKFIEAIR